MATKCYNKNLKEYKALLSKYKSDALVNALIDKHQYNTGEDTYPTVDQADELTKDKSFANTALINSLKESLGVRIKALRKELENREITNRVYNANKANINKLLRKLETTEDEAGFVLSVEFANQYLKDIKDALDSGKLNNKDTFTRGRFLSDAATYIRTYDSLRYVDTDGYSDKAKQLKNEFNNEVVILQKRIQEETTDTSFDILNSVLLESERESLSLSDYLIGEVKDINALEHNFGALATSTNPILALQDRIYKKEQYEANEKYKEDYKKLVEIDKELTKKQGSDKSFMYNTTTEGKIKNKYIVSEIQPEFYEQRKNISEKYPTVDENGDRIEYKVVDKLEDSKEANEKRQHNLTLKDNKKNKGIWFNENTEFTPEFKEQFDIFLNAKYILKDETKFINPQTKKEVVIVEYKMNPNLSEEQYKQLEYFIETQFDSSTSYKLDKEGNIIDIIEPYTEDGLINSDLSAWRPKTDNYKPKDKWKDERFDKLMSGTDIQSRYYQTYRELYDKYGKKVPEYSYRSNELIAMKRDWMSSLVANPSLKNISTSLLPDFKDVSISQIRRDENGNIIPAGLKLMYTGAIEDNLKDKINALVTKKKLSQDQVEIDKINVELSKLYSSVDINDINTNTTESLLNYMSMASNYEFKHKLEKQALTIQDTLTNTKTYSVDYFTGKLRSTDNRVAERHRDWMLARIYDEERPDRDQVATKIIDSASRLTSISGIGLALRPAIGNVITATFNNFIEGFGGQFYTVGNYIKGRTLGTANMKELAGNLSNGKQTKVNALVEKLEIFEKFNPVNPNDVVEKLDWKRKMTSDIFFIMQNAGEYHVQSSVALAMAQSHRVVNGTILNENEYKDLYKNNNFNTFPNFWDIVEFKDNKISFNTKLNKDELFNFSQRIIGVNQKIHGRYTSDDANRLQQFALGRFFQQFKRWMSSAVEERFTKKHYDYRLRSDIEGRYVTMYRLISKLKKEGLKSALNWNSLTALEQSNIRKMFAELSAIMFTYIMIYLAKGAAEDFDDEDEYYLRKAANFGAYMSDRTFNELSSFYGPSIVVNAANAPVLGTVKEIGEFMKVTGLYPFRTEEQNYYKKGTNKGRLKIEKEFGDIVPVWKDISFFNSLDVQGDYYFTIK
jgi:hypothetical protein